MKLDKSVFQKWYDWMEKIRLDLENILNYQQICEYFENVVNNNLEHIKKNNGRIFCDFVRYNYAICAAVCIRRHKRTDGDSISLMRLLQQIKKCASQFNYNFYLEIYPLNPAEPPWRWAPIRSPDRRRSGWGTPCQSASLPACWGLHPGPNSRYARRFRRPRRRRGHRSRDR